jgi:hypothetical protein
MRTSSHAIAVTVALLGISLGLVADGCGDKRPIVQVGDWTITSQAIDHWMTVIAPGGFVPDAPNYGRCVSRLSRASASRAGISEGAARRRCRVSYYTLRHRATEALISAAWVLSTAAEEGLQTIDGRLDEAELDGRAVNGPRADGRFREELTRATAQVRSTLLDPVDARISATLEADFNSREGRSSRLERRDAEVIRTKSRSASLEAKSAIEQGARFAQVARRISVDTLSRVDGGLVRGIVRSQEDKPLKRAVFGAKLGVLTGPVMLEPGRFYLFEIVKIRPAVHVTLLEFEAARRPRLQAQAYSEVLAHWVGEWVARTACRAGHVVPGCKQFRGSSTGLSRALLPQASQ